MWQQLLDPAAPSLRQAGPFPQWPVPQNGSGKLCWSPLQLPRRLVSDPHPFTNNLVAKMNRSEFRFLQSRTLNDRMALESQRDMAGQGSVDEVSVYLHLQS